MSTAHALLRELAAEMTMPICTWIGHGEGCSAEGEYRVGYPCCEHWTLLCVQHAGHIAEWIETRAHKPADHGCGASGPLGTIMHVHPIPS